MRSNAWVVALAGPTIITFEKACGRIRGTKLPQHKRQQQQLRQPHHLHKYRCNVAGGWTRKAHRRQRAKATRETHKGKIIPFAANLEVGKASACVVFLLVKPASFSPAILF